MTDEQLPTEVNDYLDGTNDERKVWISVPAEFLAVVKFDDNDKAYINHFIASPLESYAGYFGPGAQFEFGVGDLSDEQIEAAVKVWTDANINGDWPLDDMRWEE